jgi:glycine oxidase
MHTDFIIVGSGMAGITMAHTLQQQGYTFRIISQPDLSQCSIVSAGIINPVVFYRMTKSYMVDLVLPYAESFYQKTETVLNAKLIYPFTVAKIFASKEQQQLWEQRREEGVGFYLGDVNNEFDDDTSIHAPNGIGLIKGSGNFDCPAYISTSLEYFKSSFTGEEFEYDKISFHESGIGYKDFTAGKIIFCEGHLISNNPFLEKILLKPVKGEILMIKFDEPLPQRLSNYVLSKKSYLLPLGDDTFLVGATYNWKDKNDTISEEAVEQLSQNIRDITSIPFKIVSQHAGVRPAANDRRPILGVHPHHPQMAVFNGLGTKGVMLAPYFANELVQNICNQKVLHKEIDVARFFKK